MRTIVCTGIVLVVLSAVSACKRVPEHVIPPDDMAELLADRHIAEAVVDYNAQQWRTDSQRMALRDAVYARYGATQADVDTSLDWYGHHLARYMEVYDRTIEILEARVASSDTRLRADQSLTIAGDSVDVWPDSRFFAIGRLSRVAVSASRLMPMRTASAAITIHGEQSSPTISTRPLGPLWRNMPTARWSMWPSG